MLTLAQNRSPLGAEPRPGAPAEQTASRLTKTAERELSRAERVAASAQSRTNAPVPTPSRPTRTAPPSNFVDQRGEAPKADQDEINRRVRLFGGRADIAAIDASMHGGGQGGGYQGDEGEEDQPSQPAAPKRAPVPKRRAASVRPGAAAARHAPILAVRAATLGIENLCRLGARL